MAACALGALVAVVAVAMMATPLVSASAPLQGYPEFSWDTLPVYVHMCNRSGAFAPDTVQFLAKFPMVTFEKGQGEDQSPCCAEDKILAAAKQVKAVNPKTHTLFYYNSVLDWEMYRMHEVMVKTPDYWLRKSNGDPVRIPGDHTFPQPKDGMLVFDFSKPEVRSFWAGACINMSKTGFINGCFADRAGEGNFPGVGPQKSKEYDQGHILALQQAQDGLQDGVLISNNDIVPGTKATMLESFTSSKTSLQQLMAAVQAGKLVQAHAGYHNVEHETGCKNITSALATFLIAAGEYSYFGCSTGWYIDTWYHWNPEFDKPLGKPVANATKAGTTWTRKFESGTVAYFDESKEEGWIDWSS